mgnify:CR=1 FL=1
MTVYENMAFPLKLRKVPKDEIDKRVREAAEVTCRLVFFSGSPFFFLDFFWSPLWG